MRCSARRGCPETKDLGAPLHGVVLGPTSVLSCRQSVRVAVDDVSLHSIYARQGLITTRLHARAPVWFKRVREDGMTSDRAQWRGAESLV